MWQGQGVNNKTGARFDLLLTADPTNFIWRIDYGQNGNPYYCGGYWTQTGDNTFRQTMIYGACVKSGFVSFSSSGSGIASLAWNVQTGQAFTATLNRLHNLC
jgi:hypothetical protein